MNRVREYLHDHLAWNTGLDELAEISGIDRFRLSRQFKAAFGQTPHAYLVRLRLRTARRLLAGGLAVSQVAAEDRFCRSKPFRSLVPTRVPDVSGGLSEPLLKRSILMPRACVKIAFSRYRQEYFDDV
jgi:AraC-like DNA-binding protein